MPQDDNERMTQREASLARVGCSIAAANVRLLGIAHGCTCIVCQAECLTNAVKWMLHGQEIDLAHEALDDILGELLAVRRLVKREKASQAFNAEYGPSQGTA